MMELRSVIIWMLIINVHTLLLNHFQIHHYKIHIKTMLEKINIVKMRNIKLVIKQNIFTYIMKILQIFVL